MSQKELPPLLPSLIPKYYSASSCFPANEVNKASGTVSECLLDFVFRNVEQRSRAEYREIFVKIISSIIGWNNNPENYSDQVSGKYFLLWTSIQCVRSWKLILGIGNFRTFRSSICSDTFDRFFIYIFFSGLKFKS